MDNEQQAALRAPFPKDQIGLLPRTTCPDCSKKGVKCDRHSKERCDECGGWLSTAHIHLDYVGHGAVTDRLLAVDPEWNWEPLVVDDRGYPALDQTRDGQATGLWIKLTICGVTRLGYGSVPPGSFDAEKQLIGDAIRNAAMRFGVALDLWIKGQVDSEVHAAEQEEQQEAPVRQALSVAGQAQYEALVDRAKAIDPDRASALKAEMENIRVTLKLEHYLPTMASSIDEMLARYEMPEVLRPGEIAPEVRAGIEATVNAMTAAQRKSALTKHKLPLFATVPEEREALIAALIDLEPF